MLALSCVVQASLLMVWAHMAATCLAGTEAQPADAVQLKAPAGCWRGVEPFSVVMPMDLRCILLPAPACGA
jgi:hypothetical protein